MNSSVEQHQSDRMTDGSAPHSAYVIPAVVLMPSQSREEKPAATSSAAGSSPTESSRSSPSCPLNQTVVLRKPVLFSKLHRMLDRCLRMATFDEAESEDAKPAALSPCAPTILPAPAPVAAAAFSGNLVPLVPGNITAMHSQSLLASDATPLGGTRSLSNLALLYPAKILVVEDVSSAA
jgi:hypothetical protein